MRKKLIGTIAGTLLVAVVAHARYGMAVAAGKINRTVMAVSCTGETKEELEKSAMTTEERRRVWVERYLSVSYPLRRLEVTSPYGYRRDPFTGERRFHNGIDLRARGDEVLVMMEGVVVKVGQDRTSGKYVTLRHGSYQVSYCHLSRILARKGDVVHPRDVVGITGSTGRSTGEHLHITCRHDGRSVDPALLLEFVRSTQDKCVAALAKL